MGRARPPGVPTVKDRVERLVGNWPGVTAVESAGLLGEKVGTMNWCLIQLVKDGKLQREHGIGPRGGWGYFPAEAALG